MKVEINLTYDEEQDITIKFLQKELEFIDSEFLFLKDCDETLTSYEEEFLNDYKKYSKAIRNVIKYYTEVT